MRKIYAIFLSALLTTSVFAQTPQKMSYQAVIRDASNNLVKSLPVGIQISILQGSATGTPMYIETQTPTTNANGLVTIEIGSGTPVTGTFAGIVWSTGTYFIKNETDPTGGTSYTITGTSQILSVPYALYAKTSEKADELELKLQKLSNSMVVGGMVTDIDGNSYNTVKIGTQVWMAENLKTTKYRNGDLIGTTSPATLDISGETTPKYQWTYAGDESNVNTYGRLYTWYAVTDSRNVCPTGWHVPTDDEWTILTDYLTNNGYGYQGSGNDIGKSMANTSGWTTYTTAGTIGDDQVSNNSSGFTALPSGYRGLNGGFSGIDLSAYWWSSTGLSATHVYHRRVYYLSNSVDRDYAGSQNGFSVRCLRDF